MYKNLVYYNERNNEKVMDEKSSSDANNVTAYTFSHMSNTKRENANTIFTSHNLDKLDNLAEVLKDTTINNIGYYA